MPSLTTSSTPAGCEFVHQLEDIETLNKRALKGELEVSAVSIHAFAYLAEHYALLGSGSSMGDRYGPTLVTREPMTLDDLRGQTIAVPGLLTTAYLTLQLCLGRDVPIVVMPFDQILPAVAAGASRGGPLDPRGAALLWRPGLTQGRRPRPVVVRADRAPVAAGGQRGPQGPGRADGLADRPALERKHPSMPSSIARRRSTMRSGMPGTSTRRWRIGSSACTSTTGRSTTARGVARRSARSWAVRRKRV